MEKRWVIKEPGDPEIVQSLINQLKVNKHIANLLVQRGIHSLEEAQVFFEPKLSDLHDPFLMKDMEVAIARLDIAATKGEKVLVYGDYDVDGTTAIALLYTFLKKQGFQVGFYTPDRYIEGYGISYKGIDYAADNGYTLIIALDCGIKAVDKVKYALNKGID
ncbi:MAG TPA: DHH family phosphoesterase, partial [Bacteroidales bacterium]|nr:DHH family phosphoesterase [Bacteroidales bacterium]